MQEVALCSSQISAQFRLCLFGDLYPISSTAPMESYRPLWWHVTATAPRWSVRGLGHFSGLYHKTDSYSGFNVFLGKKWWTHPGRGRGRACAKVKKPCPTGRKNDTFLGNKLELWRGKKQYINRYLLATGLHWAATHRLMFCPNTSRSP